MDGELFAEAVARVTPCSCSAQRSRADAAEGALERVREIHQPLDSLMFTANGGQYMRKVCTGCGTDDGNWQIWPCPTRRAVDS